ncbi:IclR family transcriptional regulator [Caproicibacter sp.]|uniref:IclR family transcriptional regulator n=1 Tax=Caproicibacter sp. TaxID=2814884 RepID=UPI0039899992
MIKSLEKALNILECFSVEKPELGITEISQMTGLYKSNVFNIVSTFVGSGYLEQNPETEKYRIGLKIMGLSHILSTSMGFHSVVHRCINELAKAIDEIVYFGIPDGENVMYMEGAYPEKFYNIRWVQGMTAPLVCTAIGKAMLAYMEEAFIDQVLAKPLRRYTDYTITDPEILRAELMLTKKRGYSTDNMEHEYGIKCVGVPVFNRSGDLIGALSTTGPSLRFSEEQSAVFVSMLKDKAEIIRQNN